MPLFNDNRTALSALLNRSAFASPTQTVTVTRTDPTVFATPPVSGLRITWLGHSTLLIEINGQRFLIDPVWGPRASPLTFIGPKRWYEPPLPLADVPAVDAVLSSHDHYDHLDYPTFVATGDFLIFPRTVGPNPSNAFGLQRKPQRCRRFIHNPENLSNPRPPSPRPGGRRFPGKTPRNIRSIRPGCDAIPATDVGQRRAN